MEKGNQLIKVVCIAVAFLCGRAAVSAQPISTNTVTMTVKIGTLQGGAGCPGKNYGFVILTNSPGGRIWTPPVNTTTATATDISGYPAPYASTVYAIRLSDYSTWCGTNNVTFPATSSDTYEVAIYVNKPYPTNATSMNLTGQIVWTH